VNIQGSEGVGRDTLAGHVDLLAVQERHEGGQVLLHVAGRLFEADAPHALDHHLMGKADAEDQPVTGDQLHGQGLLGQHHRMPRVDRDHAGAQLDAGHLRPGGCEQGERVRPEDLACECVSEPGVGQLLQLGHRVG